MNRGSSTKKYLPALPKNILNFGELKVKDYVLYTKCLLNKEPLPTVLVSITTKGDDTWDDFQPNTALQCWNNAVTIRNNAATMLQRYVALKTSVGNRPVQLHLQNSINGTETMRFFL